MKSKFRNLTVGQSILVILFMAIIVIAGTALTGLALMLMWNALMPSIFALEPITFTQGCLMAVALSFIGSFFKK